jgi:hypothetical protein
MNRLSTGAALLMLVSTTALAQQPAPSPSEPTQLLTALPSGGAPVTNYYRQNVYDRSDNKIGQVTDFLIDKDGRITTVIIGVGGFLGIGEKDVAAPFTALRATQKDNDLQLVMNTTKEALMSAPGFKYDKIKTRWVTAGN